MGRGIDVSGISHIINYDIPLDCDDYVHRVGRTGRMSSDRARGMAFTLVGKDEGDQLTSIEKRIDSILEEYIVPNVMAVRERTIRQHVDDLPSPFAPTTHAEDEEFGVVA
jgi:ATP-dependent RNA helicase DeaD